MQRKVWELGLLGFQNPVSSLRCVHFCPWCVGSTGAIIIATFLELPALFSEIQRSHYTITIHLFQMAAYFDGGMCFFYRNRVTLRNSSCRCCCTVYLILWIASESWTICFMLPLQPVLPSSGKWNIWCKTNVASCVTLLKEHASYLQAYPAVCSVGMSNV